MKRDMDLIRQIMLAIEASPTGYVQSDLKIEGYSSEQIGYHVYLLSEAGYVVGIDTTDTSNTSPMWTVGNLTWAGHEFLAAARDPGIWQSVKERTLSVGGAVTVPILLGLLKLAIKERLGLSVDIGD